MNIHWYFKHNKLIEILNYKTHTWNYFACKIVKEKPANTLKEYLEFDDGVKHQINLIMNNLENAAGVFH